MNSNILLFCIYTISFEIDVCLFFFKQYLSINWKFFYSIDILYLSLEIDIHRYTDKDASLLSLKKIIIIKIKRSKDLFTYLICFCWLLHFFHLFFFSIGSCKMFLITVIWDFFLKEMIFVCWNAPDAHKYILSTITDLFILAHLLGAQTGNWSPKCSCYGPACVCIFPCQIFVCLSFDFHSLSL